MLFGEVNRHYGERWLAEQAAGDVYVAVAELDGQPVGRCGLNFTWQQPESGIVDLWSALVIDEARSKGIGSRLIAHLERQALERGYHTVRLGVEVDNLQAERLYRRLGYRRVGRTTDSWTELRQGTLHTVIADCWVMHKQLRPESV